MTYRSTPSDLWMPLFGIDTPEARAERLRRMLENVPWKMATELYGSPIALQLRVAQMRAELAEIETQIERGEVEERPEDLYLWLVAEMPVPAPDSKVYIGIRPESYPKEDVRVYVFEGESRKQLTHRPYHSTDGFEWGYGGSGPNDLALAILADVLGEEPAREAIEAGRPLCSWLLHWELKDEIIAGLPHTSWRLDASAIGQWAAKKLKKVQRQGYQRS